MVSSTHAINRARKSYAILCAATATAFFCITEANAQLVSPASGKQWSTTWSDEYNTGASDLTGFTYDVGGGGWGNSEYEVYTAPPGSPAPQNNPSGLGQFTQPVTGTNSNNVFVSTDGATNTGALTIRAIATGSGANESYTSGRIKTPNLFSQAYGLLEFRARLPAGTGLWPAVWMLPANATGQTQPKYGGWPTSGEIDILESKGQQTSLVQGTLNTGSSPGTLNSQTQTFAGSGLEPAGFSVTDWHTYDLQWTPGSTNVAGSIKWYVDGVLYETRSGGWSIPATAPAGNKDAPFDQPFYLLMNLAVGGNYVGGAPNIPAGSYDMQVDFMRAFSSITSVGSPSWKNDVSGNWSTGANWLSAVVPNGVGATAVLGNVLTLSRTVTVDTPITVGSLTFDSASAYTVGGSQTLSLNTTSGTPSVTVNSGAHTISAPIALLKSTTFNIIPAGGSLSITSSLGGGVTVTKTGAGSLAVKNLMTNGVSINAGTLQVPANGTDTGTSKVQSLSVTGTGALDLTNNDFVLDYTGTTPADSVRQMLQSGASSGVGIKTSLATASMRLGYADNATFGATMFGGQMVDPSSILIEYTIAGDANLDHQVDVADLGALATRYGLSALWTGGDFNYDGVTDVADLGTLASNYQSAGGGAAPQVLAASGSSAVPEPAVVGMVGIIALSMTRRRRK